MRKIIINQQLMVNIDPGFCTDENGIPLADTPGRTLKHRRAAWIGKGAIGNGGQHGLPWFLCW
jgi:hypothetical protein